MRTAKEILLTYYTQEMSEPYGHVPKDVIIKSINEARKEAIIECAEKAKTFMIDDTRFGGGTSCRVDKQSILNLIKEIT